MGDPSAVDGKLDSVVRSGRPIMKRMVQQALVDAIKHDADARKQLMTGSASSGLGGITGGAITAAPIEKKAAGMKMKKK